jgi:hypothetical protein
MHPHQMVAELGPLRGALRKLAQLDEERPRTTAVMRVVVLMPRRVLVLVHVVRPLWSVAGLLRLDVGRVRAGRLLRDARGAHSPR